MAKDTDEALKRLAEELMKEEDGEESSQDILDDPYIRELMSEDGDETRYFGDELPYAAAFNSDRTEIEPEEISGELEDPVEEGSIRGLLITAVSLSAAILLVLLWWHLRGIF